MAVTGGELLLDLLEKQGIEYIFCSPGTEWAPVWEGLLKRYGQGNNRLKYLNCRHEALAFSMAQGYAEFTGNMAAVLVHSGVGALNGALAIRNAYFARAPMLIIGGETYEHSGDGGARPQGWHWLGTLSDIGGPASMVKGFVKWSNSIKSRDNLIDLVARGCRIARAPVPGPVFLTVSPELLVRTFPEQKLVQPGLVPIGFELPLQGLEEAAAQLINSRKPVILTEHAGKTPGAVDRLVSLAELLSIPVFEFFPYFGNFPKNHPLYQGYNASQALAEADIIFVVGSTVPWYPPAACLRDNVKIILLDEDSLHEHIPHWGYQVDLALTTNISRGLDYLLKAIQSGLGPAGKVDLQYPERLKTWQVKHDQMVLTWQNEAQAEQHKQPIATRWLLQGVRASLPADSLVVDETITHTRLVHQFLGEPGRYVRPNYGGLGVGFGEAIGVKLAYPERPVVLIIGDGAFNYNPALAGLGFCQEYKMPILIMIMNNSGYLAMKMGHAALYPEGWAATNKTFLGVAITPPPDYVKIAESFGARGEKLEKPEDIETALKRGLSDLAGGKTVLLDVIL